MLIMLDILWIFVSTLVYVIALEINDCNRTISIRELSDLKPRAKVTFKHSPDDKQPLGGPYNCWFKLQGDDSQYVIVDVRALTAGRYEAEKCQNGYLRISEPTDGSMTSEVKGHQFPPTTLCGDSPIRVKRLTRGPSAFVEFHVDNSDTSQNYEFDAMFIDKEPEESLPYGHIQRTDGKINSSLCDWLVPVDTCLGGCKVISPGYPGIYPPNVVCRYTLINFEDGRIHLYLGGKHGKFDLKRSDECTEDYLVVYDGPSNTDRLFGRYCGLDSDVIISTGTTVYMELHTKAGGPPYDYSGFDLKVIDRWKNEHDFGTLNSLCDWSFTSRDTVDGNLHTPDHMIDPGTTCVYTFTGQPEEIVEVKLKIFELKPNCGESIEILDGDKVLARICDDNIGSDRRSRSRGTMLTYTTKNHEATVLYHSKNESTSNEKPTWIYYTFMGSTGVPDTENAQHLDSTNDETERLTSGTKVSNDMMTRLDVMIVLVAALCALYWS